MPIEYHQGTFALETSHKLCYTHIRWDTYQHVDMVWACLTFYNLHFHLLTQLSYYLNHVPSQFFVDNFPPVLRRKHDVILTSIT